MTENSQKQPVSDTATPETLAEMREASGQFTADSPPTIMEATVASIPDAELLERAVKAARAKGRGYQPRWVGVASAFGLGSTYAHQLCRRFDLNPSEKVKP